MHTCNVPGATGYIDTNFAGKLQAAVQELQNGQDFVYIHIEAPDECGHRGELANKIYAIEQIDQLILSGLIRALQKMGDHSILVLPDHPTPLATKTHCADPVPYFLYRSTVQTGSGVSVFDEASANTTGIFIQKGDTLMNRFLKR